MFKLQLLKFLLFITPLFSCVCVIIIHSSSCVSGDLQLKEQGNQKLQRVLIPDPELSAFYPTQRDDFMIIATDGLWDVMTSQSAVDHARSLLVQEGLLGENTELNDCYDLFLSSLFILF